MRIGIVGANGQLGADLVEVFAAAGHEVVAFNHNSLDVAEAASVTAAFSAFAMDVVVNTAAMHDVEACEADPARAFAVNAIGARNLAQAVQAVGGKLIHVSTDYVFDGLKEAPYLETDCPGPLNTYANSKLAGEFFVHSECSRHFVLRVSGIYGRHPCRAKKGWNFVTRMLSLAKERTELRVVTDEVLTPTATTDIARQILILADCDAYGLYHVTAQGACSWYEFTVAIMNEIGWTGRVEPAAPGEFPGKVNRPKYTVLDNAALRAQGLDTMPAWQDGLKAFLQSYL